METKPSINNGSVEVAHIVRNTLLVVYTLLKDTEKPGNLDEARSRLKQTMNDLQRLIDERRKYNE